jgi:hypothetical protein
MAKLTASRAEWNARMKLQGKSEEGTSSLVGTVLKWSAQSGQLMCGQQAGL